MLRSFPRQHGSPQKSRGASVGSSLNQRTAEFSLCNTLVLLLDLAFKQPTRNREL